MRKYLFFLCLAVLNCIHPALPLYSQTNQGYDVTVITGTMDGAGTDANVSIKLFGTAGATPNFLPLYQNNLAESSGGLFENGSWDTFRIPLSASGNLGTVNRIQIRHDNANSRPGWHLGAVLVKNNSTGAESVFFADRWLARDEADGRIDIILDATGAVHRIFRPPYQYSSPWEHDTIGVSDAKVWSNKASGAIGIYCDAWTGGSTAVSDMGTGWVSTANATVFARSRILYGGGCINYAIASFSELAVNRVINGTVTQRPVTPAFSGPVVLDKVVALAGIAAGGAGQAGEAVELICTMYDSVSLLNAMLSFIEAGNAVRLTDTFAFRAGTGSNNLRIGLRGTATGILTGSAFVIAGGMVESIDLVGYLEAPPPATPAVQTAQTPAAAPDPANTGSAAATTTLSFSCSQTREYPQYNRCWGWHQTHTYDLGSHNNVISVSGHVTAGPSEQKGVRFNWQLRVSDDGNTWRNAGSIAAIGAQNTAFGPIDVNQPLRYIQIYTNGQGYVDASDLQVRK